jgi:cyanate permease
MVAAVAPVHLVGAARRASGVVQAGMFTGAMIGPALFGVTVDQHGFARAWMVSAGFSAAAMRLIATGSARQRLAAASAPEQLGGHH